MVSMKIVMGRFVKINGKNVQESVGRERRADKGPAFAPVCTCDFQSLGRSVGEQMHMEMHMELA